MDSRTPHTGFGDCADGAFAVGWVLHQVFVQRALEPLAPAAVLGTVGGLLAIALSRRVERGFDPSAFVISPESEEADDDAFDEAFSPVNEEMLTGSERDDSRDWQTLPDTSVE